MSGSSLLISTKATAVLAATGYLLAVFFLLPATSAAAVISTSVNDDDDNVTFNAQSNWPARAMTTTWMTMTQTPQTTTSSIQPQRSERVASQLKKQHPVCGGRRVRLKRSRLVASPPLPVDAANAATEAVSSAKVRRSLNILNGEVDPVVESDNATGNAAPAPSWRRKSTAMLYSVSSRRFVTVGHEGKVNTTRYHDSADAVVHVIFWCSMKTSPFYPCPTTSTRSLGGSTSTLSVYGLILLQYLQTGRYLCMNKAGKLYTVLPRSEDVDDVTLDDCVFRHDIVLNKNDVYYSWKYPRRRNRLAGLSPDGRRYRQENVTSLADVGDRSDLGNCASIRWYLGVTRNGDSLRAYRATFIAPGCSVLPTADVTDHAALALPVLPPPILRRSLFIQRWVDRTRWRPNSELTDTSVADSRKSHHSQLVVHTTGNSFGLLTTSPNFYDCRRRGKKPLPSRCSEKLLGQGRWRKCKKRQRQDDGGYQLVCRRRLRSRENRKRSRRRRPDRNLKRVVESISTAEVALATPSCQKNLLTGGCKAARILEGHNLRRHKAAILEDDVVSGREKRFLKTDVTRNDQNTPQLSRKQTTGWVKT